MAWRSPWSCERPGSADRMALTHEPPAILRTRTFWPGLGAMVTLGAIIRYVYVATDLRSTIGGDGFEYHFSALRLGEGLGYTSTGFGTVAEPIAHHPPGWVTVLGIVAWLGGRSVFTQQ